MGTTGEYGSGCHEIARRFLQTAVVVDDEAYMARVQMDVPDWELVVPGRSAHASSQEDPGPGDRAGRNTLDARSVMNSFAKLGVICGVVGPGQSAMEMLRQADIVVLDWLLQNGDPGYALGLLRDLLTGEVDRNSLRLVAIYTGEARLEDIYKAVFAQLKETGLQPEENKNATEIPYRHGRVVFYAKADVNLAEHLKDRSVAEEALPERLVEDFSAMTEGLLPSIALTSLTAVREGAHRVLDQFCADLDPAFLAHRACLSNPDDAEQQIVDHVAEELRGLMDNAVAARSPAGAPAVEGWIRHRNGGASRFVFGDKELTLDQTVTLAKKGLEPSDLPKKAFEDLSAGFADNGVDDLDERLAWIMSFRTVYNAPPPTLWLGSVVTEMVDDGGRHLICMRPRCDCVRLKEETSFFFLPLIEPRKAKEQLVVRLGNKFKRLGVGLDPAGWIHRRFKPSEGKRAVTATKKEAHGPFVFKNTRGQRYTWRGELKTEYTQRLAQNLAKMLSRVAVNESEWLRRMVRKGS